MSDVELMSEAQLQEAVIELAQLRGWLVYHTHDSRRSQPGFPDLTMVRRTRMIFSELKTEKGRLTPNQADCIAALGAVEHGGGFERGTGERLVQVFLWRPADLRNGTIAKALR